MDDDFDVSPLLVAGVDFSSVDAVAVDIIRCEEDKHAEAEDDARKEPTKNAVRLQQTDIPDFVNQRPASN